MKVEVEYGAMSQNQVCQGCSRHCPLDDLRCGRGRKLLKTMQEQNGQHTMFTAEEGAEGHPMGDRWSNVEPSLSGACPANSGMDHHYSGHRRLRHGREEEQQAAGVCPHCRKYQGIKKGHRRAPWSDPALIETMDWPLEQKLTYMLRFLGRSMGKRAGRQVRMRLMMMLHDLSGQAVDAAGAARRLGVGEPDVYRMLRKLEKAGLVASDRPGCRPANGLAQVTPRGMDMLSQWRQAVPAGGFSGYEGLSPEECQQLLSYMQKLAMCTPWQAVKGEPHGDGL